MGTMTEKPRRTWTPLWETHGRSARMLSPPEIRPWAYDYKTGKLIDLPANYNKRENLTDAQRPVAWSRVPRSEVNKEKLITLTWEQVQKAMALCREKDWPIKKGVAAVINRDDFLKSQLALLVGSPETYLRNPSYAGPDAKPDEEWGKASEDFFASVAKDTAPAKATVAATKPDVKG